jgi:hypothetical protein
MNIFAFLLENSLPPRFAYLEGSVADKDFVSMLDNLPRTIYLLLDGEELLVEIIVYSDLFHGVIC